MVAGGPAWAADDRDDLRKQKAENLKALKELAGQLEDVTKELADAYVAFEETKASLPLAEAEVTDATAAYTTAKTEHDAVVARLERAQADKAAIEEQIRDAEQRVVDAQSALAQLARESMSDDAVAQSQLLLLLGATSVDQIDSRYVAVEAAARARGNALVDAREEAALNRNREARLGAVTEEISALEGEAQASLDRAIEAKEAAEKARDELNALLAAQERHAEDLKYQTALLKEQEAQLEADNVAINQRLKDLEAAERARAESGAPPVSDGTFGPPLSSLRITSPFGYRTHPITKVYKLHTGVDFSAACGTPIYATSSGTVIIASMLPAWGNRIEINHGIINGHFIVSSYNHLSSFSVSPGDHVERGQVIGLVGTTGYSTGCHLHYEVLSNGAYTDPMAFL
jgi:murein DD-endopeptidase MepM/ murein hydrolase activator NlpD